MAGSISRAENRSRMRQHLELRQREGLTFRELSRRTGVTIATLTRWQRVFREENEGVVSGPPTSLEGDSGAFVELTISPERQGDASMPPFSSNWYEILINDVAIKVPIQFDDESLSRLISILRKPC